jgi:hypothetical protein
VKDNKGSDPNKNTVDVNKDNDGKTDTKPADTKTKPPAGPDSKPQAGDSLTKIITRLLFYLKVIKDVLILMYKTGLHVWITCNKENTSL